MRRGLLELGQIKRIFREFDEDGDSKVFLAEFCHVVRRVCPSEKELSQGDLQRLCRLADANNDGRVAFKEFPGHH